MNILKIQYKLADNIIHTGIVRTHAITIFLIVFACKFFTPFVAVIAPAIPDDKICVVLTGKYILDEL